MLNFILKDIPLSLSTLFLLGLGLFVLNSLSPSVFPAYFIYVIVAVAALWLFSQFDFDVTALFSKHFYIGSVALLVLTLIIGQVTRGTIRWIPIGSLTFQPAELVRPFLLVFFADYLTKGELTLTRLIKAIALLLPPVFLILVQPSLGVSILMVVGFFGILLAGDFNKKNILIGTLIVLALLPVFWLIMQPYQRQRVTGFFNPEKDPLGAGYNSIQSMISIGAGEFFGRGLGRGVQTQLAFLPEKSSDFIFAGIAEELGFVGAGFLIIATFLILYRLTVFLERASSPAARAYLSGFIFTYFAQVIVHIGMNLGLLPVTGLPLPLVSAGGSSLLGTMIGLGIALGAYKK